MRPGSDTAAVWGPLLLALILSLSAAWAAASPAPVHTSATGQDPWRTVFVGNGTWSPSVIGPFNRSRSSVAYDAAADRVILFGGLEGLTFEGDTWSYDPATEAWTNVTGIGAPSPRVDASMVYDSVASRVILFGGAWWTWDPAGGIYWGGVGADTWTFNSATDSWIQLQPDQSPPARSGASMAYDSHADRIVLFGGYNGSTFFNDTWALDYANSTWVNLTDTVAPSRRLGAAMTYDAAAGRAVLFGGYNGSASFGDTWWFDYGGRNWVRQSPSTSPSPRFRPGFVYDPVVGWDVLFGGFATNAETWSYQAASNEWIPLFPSSSPPGCTEPSLVYVASASKPLLVDMCDGQPTQTWWYGPPLSAPSAPVSVHATQGFGGVQLTWGPPLSSGGSAIAGYRIYRGTSSGTEVLLASVGNVTSYADTTTPSTGTLFYLVSAVNAVGEGPYSSEAAVALGGIPSVIEIPFDLGIVIAFGILAIVLVAVVLFAMLWRKPRPPPSP